MVRVESLKLLKVIHLIKVCVKIYVKYNSTHVGEVSNINFKIMQPLENKEYQVIII